MTKMVSGISDRAKSLFLSKFTFTFTCIRSVKTVRLSHQNLGYTGCLV